VISGARVAQWVRSLDLTTHTSLSPIRRGFAPGLVIYKKGCTRLAAASDKVYQLFSHGRWLSPGTPASSITKTGRHDIAEILLKVALKHQKSNQINQIICDFMYLYRIVVHTNFCSLNFFTEKNTKDKSQLWLLKIVSFLCRSLQGNLETLTSVYWFI